MAYGGERPTWSSKKYKNYNEFRQAVLAWKKQQPDPKNPRVGDKKVIARKRVGSKIIPAHTVIWNGKKWVKKGDVSLVPDRVGKVDLNSKEYKRAKEINERSSKKNNNKKENNNNNNNNNNNKKIVPKKDNKKKVIVKEENNNNNNQSNNNKNKNKDKLKIKTPKGFVRDKGRLYSINSAEGRKVSNKLKARNRVKEKAKKRKEAKQK